MIWLDEDSPTPQGIEYRMLDLYPNGESFQLYVGPDHTDADIEQAKRWIRYRRDVVKFVVRRMTRVEYDNMKKELDGDG